MYLVYNFLAGRLDWDKNILNFDCRLTKLLHLRQTRRTHDTWHTNRSCLHRAPTLRSKASITIIQQVSFPFFLRNVIVFLPSSSIINSRFYYRRQSFHSQTLPHCHLEAANDPKNRFRSDLILNSDFNLEGRLSPPLRFPHLQFDLRQTQGLLLFVLGISGGYKYTY